MVLHDPNNQSDEQETENSVDINSVPSSMIIDALNAIRRFQKKPSTASRKEVEATRQNILNAEDTADSVG